MSNRDQTKSLEQQETVPISEIIEEDISQECALEHHTLSRTKSSSNYDYQILCTDVLKHLDNKLVRSYYVSANGKNSRIVMKIHDIDALSSQKSTVQPEFRQINCLENSISILKHLYHDNLMNLIGVRYRDSKMMTFQRYMDIGPACVYNKNENVFEGIWDIDAELPDSSSSTPIPPLSVKSSINSASPIIDTSNTLSTPVSVSSIKSSTISNQSNDERKKFYSKLSIPYASSLKTATSVNTATSSSTIVTPSLSMSVSPFNCNFVHKFTEDEIRDIFYQAAEALFYLHSNGVLHTNIRPYHILLSSDGMVRLSGMDYLICAATDASGGLREALPWVDHLYMAPECSAGESFFPIGCDIWALGVSIYCILFNHPPLIPDQFYNYITLTEDKEHPKDYKDIIDYKDISDEFRDLFHQIFAPLVVNRIEISKLLKHPFFTAHGYPYQHENEKWNNFLSVIEDNDDKNDWTHPCYPKARLLDFLADSYMQELDDCMQALCTKNDDDDESHGLINTINTSIPLDQYHELPFTGQLDYNHSKFFLKQLFMWKEKDVYIEKGSLKLKSSHEKEYTKTIALHNIQVFACEKREKCFELRIGDESYYLAVCKGDKRDAKTFMKALLFANINDSM